MPAQVGVGAAVAYLTKTLPLLFLPQPSDPLRCLALGAAQTASCHRSRDRASGFRLARQAGRRMRASGLTRPFLLLAPPLPAPHPTPCSKVVPTGLFKRRLLIIYKIKKTLYITNIHYIQQ